MTNREYESRETNQSRNEGSSSTFFWGAVIGGVVGAAAALLFAPKSGRELRTTLGSQADTIMDKTVSLKENVVAKSNELASKTSSFSQGIVLQSSELVNKVKGKTSQKDQDSTDSEGTYIPIQNPNESPSAKKSDSNDIKKKLEETQKAFDEEESKVKL
ncbi:YtxH domain-containing protein [Bacillus sp. ISL-18]|uniref:YtxH domain-containing protein n=1 Tax=Bacillus sp. ISL-18 TaxID=2819118 RepID=UPI001BE5B57E|nr:YtxH domain-containing protein [Bacillus sp. ISL-18]MBT2656963.1 YtxH domain-containing protein [Bacillus sp. ISL-18]